MAQRLVETISGVTGPGVARTQGEAEAWAQYARNAAAALRARAALPEVNVVGMGPVLHQGERAFFQGGANYARLYGGDGTYAGSSLIALGSPAFMLGAFAARGIINHRRKVRARRDAVVQWRDHQRAGIIATSHRLMVQDRPRLGNIRIRRDLRLLPGPRKFHPHTWIRRAGRTHAPRRAGRPRRFRPRGRRHHARPLDARPAPTPRTRRRTRILTLVSLTGRDTQNSIRDRQVRALFDCDCGLEMASNVSVSMWAKLVRLRSCVRTCTQSRLEVATVWTRQGLGACSYRHGAVLGQPAESGRL